VTPFRQSIAVGLIVVTTMAMPVGLRAQHGSAAHPASQPSSRPASNIAEAPAAPAPAPPSQTGAVAPASAKPAPSASRPPDVKSIVDRIQKRIAEEVPSRSDPKPAAQVGNSGRQGASAAGGSPATSTRSGGTARRASGQTQIGAPARSRVQLEWRLTLVWPAELIQ
jgi:hypothetical protein